MIVGLGVELVDRARFETALARFGDRMRRRLFTPRERAGPAGAPYGAESLAARFAAKVATRRALQLRGAAWHDVEVVRAADRPPALVLRGRALAAARAAGADGLSLTLTHDPTWCIGQVVLEAHP